MTPAAMSPTVDSWRAAGLSCDGPFEGNVPSGLLQWTCHGTLAGVEIWADVEGDDKGVFDAQAQVPADTSPASAGTAFGVLISATPALSDVATAATTWVRSSVGSDGTGSFGSASFILERDVTWLTLSIWPGPRHSVDQAPGAGASRP
jgi:hypothetical protein